MGKKAPKPVKCGTCDGKGVNVWGKKCAGGCTGGWVYPPS